LLITFLDTDAFSSNKDAIIEALRVDLGRTVIEATIEVGFALKEIKALFEASDFARLVRAEQNTRKVGIVRRPTGLLVVVVAQHGSSFVSFDLFLASSSDRLIFSLAAPLLSLAVQLSSAIGAGNVVLCVVSPRRTTPWWRS